MSDEYELKFERARRAAEIRHGCPKCRNTLLYDRDGSEVDGLPGITYRCCNNCGWMEARTRRTPREKL